MVIDWIHVIEETFTINPKPIQRALFQMWLNFVAARDWAKVEAVESLLQRCGSGICAYCDLPIDPDETYCILCRDRDREKHKRYLRACKKTWTLVVSLHQALTIFCNSSPRNINDLVTRLRTVVGELKNRRRTEASIWTELKCICERVEGDADSASRRKLLEECCPRDEEESERRRTREVLKQLHQLVKHVPALRDKIVEELQRCGNFRRSTRRPRVLLGSISPKFS